MNQRAATAQRIADLEGMTDRFSNKPIQWWMTLMVMVLLCGLVAMLWWTANLLQTTIRQNTEALARVTAVVERLERKSP